MPGDYRVLGRDSTLRISQGGALITEITAVKANDFKPVFTLISEGLIGEAAKRHREIFDEIDVTFSVQPEGLAILQMQSQLYARARSGQNLAAYQVNLAFYILFTSGQTARITVPDLKFSDPGGLINAGRETFQVMNFAAKSDRYIPNY